MAEKNGLGEFLERVYPEHGKLQVDEKGGLHTIIVDEEMDGFTCRFNYDGCVEIDTDEYSHIALDSNTLHRLANLIEEAEEIYKNRTQEEWDSFPD